MAIAPPEAPTAAGTVVVPELSRVAATGIVAYVREVQEANGIRWEEYRM